MRVAIVHYWLLGMRGGENVVEALCRMFPEADIFTLFYDASRTSETIRSHRITASYLNPLRRYYRSLLPWMPSALESFDLRGYDLVISSESGPAKGVLVPSTAEHICYCHTPMRYLWELYPAYLNEWTHNRVKRALMRPISRNLRMWDYAAAARVDRFIANSENVRGRIWRAYRRESEVIYPPVAVETFYHRPSDDYFLIVAELVAYKQVDYAVRAFASNGRKLRVVGEGPEYRRLKREARSNVEFCGRVPALELRELYARSRALIVPGEEDFGINMVEALASGKPIVALNRGGASEIVPDYGGLLYEHATSEDLEATIVNFEALECRFDADRLNRYAQRFSEAFFVNKIGKILADVGSPAINMVQCAAFGSQSAMTAPTIMAGRFSRT
jgi:glycosyltransferase involved in cell wall biosynthesis